MLGHEQLEALRYFDTPTVCNAIEFFKLRPRTCGFGLPGMVWRGGDSSKAIVGYAVTARVGAIFPETPEPVSYTHLSIISSFSACTVTIPPAFAIAAKVRRSPGVSM